TSGTGTGTVGGPVNLGSATNVGGAGTLTINGLVTGTLGNNFHKVGAGFTTLGGGYFFTASAISVDVGTLILTAAGTAPSITVASGAVLNVRTTISTPLFIAGTGISGNGALRTSTGFTGVVGGAVTLTAASSIGNGTGTGGGNLTINGVISG